MFSIINSRGFNGLAPASLNQSASLAPPTFVLNPRTRSIGTQTTPGLLEQHQLPPGKRSYSMAFEGDDISRTAGTGPHWVAAATNRGIQRGVQVPEVHAIPVFNPATPHTVHWVPGDTGN